MTITIEGGVIRLAGRCRIEDAEILLAALQADPDSAVDLGACTSLHTALVQLLMAATPRIHAAPGDGAIYRWLMPLLQTGGGPFGLPPVSL
jgi:hypothetical protein